MKKKNSTKQALISSILVLALCCTMLVGTTFAWFTDSVSSNGNIIKSGVLDVAMYWAEGTKAIPADDSADWKDAAEGAIFNYDKWEPGYVQVRHIKIANEGSLALKYKVNIVANGVVTDLADVIDVYYADPAVQVADRTSLTDDNKLGTLTEVLAALGNTGNGTLAAETNDTITIAFKMQETAGNEYMDKSIGADFSVQLIATQLASEDDDFGNDYDNGAVYAENVSTSVVIPENATENETFTTENGTTVEVPAEVLNALPDEVESMTLGHSNPVVETVNNTVTFDSVEFYDQNGNVIDLSANTTPVTVTFPVAFADGTTVEVYHDDELVCVTVANGGKISYEVTHFCQVTLAELLPLNVASEEDLLKATAGQTINITADITLSSEVTLPAGVTLVGNGKQINGTIYAGGDLTIEGHVKVTAFSASYYDRVITIGPGACLEITGGGRVSLAYGNVFNITGTIEDAKTADKATVQPSLIIPAGISITGGSDATLNVTNAYVVIGSTSSKNSSANGTFTLNFNNSIAEFTNQLTLAEPTSGKTPTFDINIVDSVFTTGTKFIIAAPNSNVVIDNSTVTAATYFRNSGNLTLQNGSVLTASTIQFGENGGNDGITTVDNSALNITASSAGHALDGKGTGAIILKNNATANVTYYKALTVTCDESSTFNGTEA